MLRRGSFGLAGTRARATIAIETAASLGERRSLVIVKVEGRRLLLGLTPQAVSLVSELAPAPGEPAQEPAR
jgi:flagellar protein FliO/FliZ